MVPSGDYFDGEEGTGFKPGCAIILCAAALLIFGKLLVAKLDKYKDTKMVPRRELHIQRDTCSKIIDTMHTYKTR